MHDQNSFAGCPGTAALSKVGEPILEARRDSGRSAPSAASSHARRRSLVGGGASVFDEGSGDILLSVATIQVDETPTIT